MYARSVTNPDPALDLNRNSALDYDRNPDQILDFDRDQGRALNLDSNTVPLLILI